MLINTVLAVPAAASVFTSTHWLGIPIAVLGAVFLSLGTIYQGRGVGDAEGKEAKGLSAMIRRPVWVVGTLMLAVAVALQLTALRFSPLMVVQPIGAAALVVTVLARIRSSGRLPGRRAALSVLLCVAGIAVFVTIAALSAQDVSINDGHLRTILFLLAGALVLLSMLLGRLRRRMNAVLLTAGAGILYGFEATLAKAVIGRIAQGDFEWLSVTGLAGLIIALVFGASLVQRAHAVGTPGLVVAGLTVIDPMVAVAIGITVLGEADTAPPAAFIGFLLAGVAAVAGVYLVSTTQLQSADGTQPLEPIRNT